jgi:hypothetical protein
MKYSFILIAVALIFVSHDSFAQYGAISTATAGSGRAAIEVTEAPLLNPASIPFSQGYFFTSDFATIGDGQEFTIGLTDNLNTTVVPTSMIYTEMESTNAFKNKVTTQDMHLSLANIVSKTFSFGLSVEHKIDTELATKFFQTNMMMGSIFSIGDNLGLAVVLDHMLPTDGSIPNDYRFYPTTAIGLSYTRGSVIRFKLDVESAGNNSFDEPAIAGGVETYWNRWVIFRIGFRKDFALNSNQYGAGIGFTGPKFAIHYGYLSSPETQDLARHSIDFAIPIW